MAREKSPAIARERTSWLVAYTIEHNDPDEVVRELNAGGIKHRRQRHGNYFSDPDGLVVQVSGPNLEGCEGGPGWAAENSLVRHFELPAGFVL